jgi:putative endonuclease
MNEYYVYIMASHVKTLYTGMTRDVIRRVFQHKSGKGGRFTAKYGVDRLVFYESTIDVMAAIEREKQIKSWTRAKKIALIQQTNPAWKDLSFGWYDSPPSLAPSGSDSSAASECQHVP